MAKATTSSDEGDSDAGDADGSDAITVSGAGEISSGAAPAGSEAALPGLWFTHDQLLAAVVGAAIHDIDHPGLNNDFLVSLFYNYIYLCILLR